MLREESTDWFSELIDESAGPDWVPRDGAKHIVAFLHSDCEQARDFRNCLKAIIAGVEA